MSAFAAAAISAVVTAAFVITLQAFAYIFWLRRRVALQSVSLNLPFNLGSATYRASPTDRTIAWCLYVQLQTRKAALPFDDQHDVVAEVFDSLYELFPLIRELLVQLPLSEVHRTDSIADMLLRVQNDGLRPVLTKWQALFRRWWTSALQDKAYAGRSPQDIQRSFPNYGEMLNDVHLMNAELNKYAEELLKVARGEAVPKLPQIEAMAPTEN